VTDLLHPTLQAASARLERFPKCPPGHVARQYAFACGCDSLEVRPAGVGREDTGRLCSRHAKGWLVIRTTWDR
jgi:hypothetical protein